MAQEHVLDVTVHADEQCEKIPTPTNAVHHPMTDYNRS